MGIPLLSSENILKGLRLLIIFFFCCFKEAFSWYIQMSSFQKVLPRIVLNINPLDSDSHSDYRALSLSVLYTCHCLKLLKHIFLFFYSGKRIEILKIWVNIWGDVSSKSIIKRGFQILNKIYMSYWENYKKFNWVLLMQNRDDKKKCFPKLISYIIRNTMRGKCVHSLE